LGEIGAAGSLAFGVAVVSAGDLRSDENPVDVADEEILAAIVATDLGVGVIIVGRTASPTFSPAIGANAIWAGSRNGHFWSVPPSQGTVKKAWQVDCNGSDSLPAHGNVNVVFDAPPPFSVGSPQKNCDSPERIVGATKEQLLAAAAYGPVTPTSQPSLNDAEAAALGRWLTPESGGPTTAPFYDFVYSLWYHRRGAVDCSMFHDQAVAVLWAAFPDSPAKRVNQFVELNLHVASAILGFLAGYECVAALDQVLPIDYFAYGHRVALASQRGVSVAALLSAVAAGDMTLHHSDAEERLRCPPATEDEAFFNTMATLRQRRRERVIARRLLPVVGGRIT
jgi:hypothetical protein